MSEFFSLYGSSCPGLTRVSRATRSEFDALDCRVTTLRVGPAMTKTIEAWA